MSKNGMTVSYLEYRAHFLPKVSESKYWSWTELLNMLGDAKHTERGSLTLTLDGSVDGCELLPGLAINIQCVKTGCSTLPHAHSWWHLFLVQEGVAEILSGNDSTQSVRFNDLFIVPAGISHSIKNIGNVDLKLLSISNLPQQVNLGSFFAQEPKK